jgi:hypothetical protein
MKKVMVEGALEVAEDALRNSELGLTRVMHMKHTCWTMLEMLGPVKLRY